MYHSIFDMFAGRERGGGGGTLRLFVVHIKQSMHRKRDAYVQTDCNHDHDRPGGPVQLCHQWIWPETRRRVIEEGPHVVDEIQSLRSEHQRQLEAQRKPHWVPRGYQRHNGEWNQMNGTFKQTKHRHLTLVYQLPVDAYEQPVDDGDQCGKPACENDREWKHGNTRA